MVNAFYTENGKPIKQKTKPSLAEQLDEWKRAAQAVSEPSITDWTFNGVTLLMHPNGAGRGQYLRACHNSLEAITSVHIFLQDILQDEVFLQLSEVHLCADIISWHGIKQLNQQRDFVSRSRKRGVRWIYEDSGKNKRYI